MARAQKSSAPRKKLIVAGCLVERYRDQILQQIPRSRPPSSAPGEVERIIEAVEGDLKVSAPPQPPAFLYHDPHAAHHHHSKNTRAYIKIAEGCDHPCTFCIIPQLRGAFRSRRV